MRTLVVSAPDATSGELEMIKKALLTTGLDKTFKFDVSSKFICVLNMEEEVYLRAERCGYEIKGHERELDAIAYDIVYENEWLGDKTAKVIDDELEKRQIPKEEVFG